MKRPEIGTRELKMFWDFVSERIEAGDTNPGLFQFVTSLAPRNRTDPRYQKVVDLLSQTAGGLDGILLAKEVAIQALTSLQKADDPGKAIPPFREFTAIFNTISEIEKRRPGFLPHSLAAQRSGVHRRAIDLLAHPKLRVFAPVFALFATDAPIPSDLKTFIRDLEPRISVSIAHAGASAHAF